MGEPTVSEGPQVLEEVDGGSRRLASPSDYSPFPFLLITTNQLVTQWGTVFGDEVLAAAILDRLLHHSHTLNDPGRKLSIAAEEEGGIAWCECKARKLDMLPP